MARPRAKAAPRGRPAGDTRNYRPKTIRFPPDLYTQLKHYAVATDTTVQAIVVAAVRTALPARRA